MTKYADKSNEELASMFIVSTCQMLPKWSPVLADSMHNLLGSQRATPTGYSIFCGSAMEFYIRPLNACIDDTDFLLASAGELAFSGECLVLPSDMSGLADTIDCYKIEPYDMYPGFVRLRICEKMIYNWKYKKYEFNHTAHINSYIWINMDLIATEFPMHSIGEMNVLPNIISGPAIKSQAKRERSPCYIVQSDLVRSVWCPQWPKEAQGWIKRPRNNGWPTIDTIAEVVQNGCHVVYVQHRSCRDDIHQWRMSFSVAEVILLQSWTQTQQIVYHLLRFFAKRELIQKDCPKEDEVLCPYHLKTLMLWTCEDMSPEWWNSSSVIAICCELLQKLSKWLKRRHCPNYFIPEANLLHQPSNCIIIDNAERQLNVFCQSGILCHWFVENYILSFIHKHFDVKRTLKETTHLHFMDFMLPLIEIWRATDSESLEFLFHCTYSHNDSLNILKQGSSSGLQNSLTLGYYSRCVVPRICDQTIHLRTIQNVSCFTYYDILLHLLNAAYCLGCGEISWNSSLFVELVNAISKQGKITRSKFHNFPKAYTAQSSQFQFLRAQGLMENLTGSNSRSEFQLVSLMSKEFLRKALQYDDSNSKDITPASLAYLAALHFATSEYQQATHLCLAVLVDHTSEKNKETLNAGCLLFIDDVASIVGLLVLYKKIIDMNLHYIGRQLYLDLRLSPVVFAHYLTVLSTNRTLRHLNFSRDFPDSAFTMDEYLKNLLKPRCIDSIKSGTHFNAARQRVYQRTNSLLETEFLSLSSMDVKETVIDVLMECALENMTSFYSVIRNEFGIQCNTTVCYRALYLYKRRQYDEMLHLCERILRKPELQSDLKKFSFANVLVLPPLDSFFDGDVQSLLGLHTLIYYLSSLNDVMGKDMLFTESTFDQLFARFVYHNRRELFSLEVHYSIMRHYFIGRHFVARYLKVRCCMDCNLPYEEAVTEFAAMKVNLPFEQIIRRFLIRQLHIIKK